MVDTTAPASRRRRASPGATLAGTPVDPAHRRCGLLRRQPAGPTTPYTRWATTVTGQPRTPGNSSTATQVVTIVDTTPPSIEELPDFSVEQTSRDGTPVFLTVPTVGDNCDANPSLTNDAPAKFPLGLTMVMWTARDFSGNTSRMIVVVEVEDTTPPVIEGVGDVTVEQQGPNGTVLTLWPTRVTDICDSSPTWWAENNLGMFPLGVTEVKWHAVDDSGNETIVIQLITVQDTTPPTLQQPSDVTAEQTDRNGTPVTLVPPTATDLCDANPRVTNDAPAKFPLGTTTVTWTATDASGNSTQVTQKVSIVDTTPPVIIAPPGKVVEQQTPNGTAVNLGIPVVWDLCDANPLVVNNAPGVFPLGLTIVTWTAIDFSGNWATGVQAVNVVDTTPPAIQIGDVVAEQTNRAGTPVFLGIPNVSDNCDIAPAVGNNGRAVYPLGVTLVTWTAVDFSGNVGVWVQQVIVRDRRPPNIAAPAARRVEQTSHSGTPVALRLVV